jgi:FdhD protein
MPLSTPQSLPKPFPRLTAAQAPLTQAIVAVNEHGESVPLSIPAERALTVYVDKRELVTLMTLGASPELLVLGYLRNQRLVRSVDEIESVTVDWDIGEGLLDSAGAAAVKTRSGIVEIEARTAKKVVTTGCGQGSVFGELLDEIDAVHLPAVDQARMTQGQLYGVLNTIRLQESTYKSSGSVHGCALFSMANGGHELLLFVEDVGRHNAMDTIAGWLWMQDEATRSGGDKLFYTSRVRWSSSQRKWACPWSCRAAASPKWATRWRKAWACARWVVQPTGTFTATPRLSDWCCSRIWRRWRTASRDN